MLWKAVVASSFWSSGTLSVLWDQVMSVKSIQCVEEPGLLVPPTYLGES